MNKEQLNQKLIEAIEGEDVNKANILIEKGADVNARDKEVGLLKAVPLQVGCVKSLLF